MPDIVGQCTDSIVLDLRLRIVSLPVEVIGEEHVDFINQQDLWSLVFTQVNLGLLRLMFILEDQGS